jgi:hypothetical protein
MANQLNRIFRRRPEIDEAEVGLLHSRVLARLRRPEQGTESEPAIEIATNGAVGEPIDPMAIEDRVPPSDAT